MNWAAWSLQGPQEHQVLTTINWCSSLTNQAPLMFCSQEESCPRFGARSLYSLYSITYLHAGSQQSKWYLVSWCTCKNTLNTHFSFNLISKHFFFFFWLVLSFTLWKRYLITQFYIILIGPNAILVQSAHCTDHYVKSITYIISLAFHKAVCGSQVIFFPNQKHLWDMLVQWCIDYAYNI